MKQHKLKPQSRVYSLAAITGAVLGASWLMANTVTAAFLGIITAILICITLKISNGKIFPFYITGIISHSIAFYWLIYTINHFGNFPLILAILLFLLFTMVSALQFAFSAFIYKHLDNIFDCLSMKASLAWIVPEILVFRIFPWYLGHSQSIFLPFIQTAEIGGATLVSFSLIFIVELFINSITTKRIKYSYIGIAIFISVIAFGKYSINKFSKPEAPIQRFALVQGNISLEEKHSSDSFQKNIDTYRNLSLPFSDRSTIVVWPESVVMQWIPNSITNTNTYPGLIPTIGTKTPLLFGGLSYDSPAKKYNTAFAVMADGSIPKPYNKRILMPYGEYTPFGSVFPWMADLNETAANFTPGKSPAIFSFENGQAKVSPLICYEDVVSDLAREAVSAGGDFLINMTNDAWFGDTPAPYQHHQIALFRAVENRRFLLRATNTGLTASVSPTGETTLQVPGFTEQTMLAETWQVRYKTIYTLLGDMPWKIFAWLIVVVTLWSFIFPTVRLKPGKNKQLE